MNIKAALLDLDNTLANTREAYTVALKECHKVFARHTGLKTTHIEFLDLYKKARVDTVVLTPNTAAKLNRAIYFQKMIEGLNMVNDFDLVYKLYYTYYSYAYKNIKLFPEAKELLDWLKETGRKVIIVSNGNAHTRLEKLQALKITHYIDHLVSAEEVGVAKPSSQPFLVALNKARLHPEDVVMVGDSSTQDIYGANRLGIITIQHIPRLSDIPEDSKPKTAEENPRYSVSHLKEVIDIIKYLEGQSS